MISHFNFTRIYVFNNFQSLTMYKYIMQKFWKSSTRTLQSQSKIVDSRKKVASWSMEEESIGREERIGEACGRIYTGY